MQDKARTILELGRGTGMVPRQVASSSPGPTRSSGQPERPAEITGGHLSRQYDQHVTGGAPLQSGRLRLLAG